jgi:hypothetical protein
LYRKYKEFKSQFPGAHPVKLLGLLLLVSGWAIALAAVALLKTTLERSVFVLAGIGVEILALVLAVIAHRPAKGEGE